MKTKRRLVATALLLTMLLATFGSGFTAAAHTVTTGSELAYDPLAKAASIAYEKHGDGYTVSLDRAADSVTMNITAVPGSRAAEKAQLYVHTGVELKAGTAYRVSFLLSAAQEQPEYAVCLDGGAAECAYGRLDKRSIAAGGEDRVDYQLIPEKESGELVLRLMLGKTGAKGNTLRLSGLAVEEAAGEVVGENKVLVDKLDYSEPGAITYWANEDSGATVTSDGSSATLTVTRTPAQGAEVWKIKLMVATGLKPEAGKTYRISYDVKASAAGEFEVCYNEGDNEKGYDVQYSQRLSSEKETRSRRIYVPSDKENPGELILQLSLGKLGKNTRVTVSNVRVEEAVPEYKDALAKDFAYDKTSVNREYDSNNYNVTKINKTTTITLDGKMTASSSGDTKDGEPVVAGGSVTQKIRKPAAGESDAWGTQCWDTRLNIDTGETLEANNTYRVSYKINSDIAFNSQANYGKGLDAQNNIDNDKYYLAEKWHWIENTTTVTDIFTSKEGGKLLISLLLGETGKQANTVTVSDIKIEKVQVTEQYSSDNIANVTYPKNGSFRVRSDNTYTADLSGNDSSATLTFTGDNTTEVWKRGFFIDDICNLTSDSQYKISFDITTEDYQVTFTKSDGFEDFIADQSASKEIKPGSLNLQDNKEFSYEITPTSDCTLYMRVECGAGDAGKQVTISNVKVEKGSSPTSFEKVSGWEIVPPSSLGQKNDFRDPQAYYDAQSKTISLTVTASQDGAARILKYTLGKDLQNEKYDGIIFTDPTGAFFNLECSDTFRIGNKWYLTYSGQEDTLWYAMADSRFGPYSAPMRLEGKLFYAAKHVEDGTNAYMIGWARRSNSAASTQEVSGWAGNIAVQKLCQQPDGSLSLVPVDSIVSSFGTQMQLALGADRASLKADTGRSYEKAFTSYESFMLSGEFTYSGTGSFGLAFDFNGKEEQYKLISVSPEENKLSLSLNGGAAPITETQAALEEDKTHSFTYIQDGSVGIFYLDGQAALTVRLYGVTGKPIYLFAENNSVEFTSLRQYT